jgi:hypothetical protein
LLNTAQGLSSASVSCQDGGFEVLQNFLGFSHEELEQSLQPVKRQGSRQLSANQTFVNPQFNYVGHVILRTEYSYSGIDHFRAMILLTHLLVLATTSFISFDV